MKDTVRVLHITEMLSAAGIESFIMNMYRLVNRERVQFDFLVLRDTKEFYDDEIRSLGGKKYCITSDKKNTLFRILDESKKIEAFLREHPYNIVHVHYTTSLRAPYMKALKNAGVKTRIYHSHSAYVTGKSVVKKCIYQLMRKELTKYATHYFACSIAAAKWIYEKEIIKNYEYRVIPNGIDSDRFAFNESSRAEIREQLKLEERFVLIHTGRFTAQKNQQFVVEILNELVKYGVDVVLLLLGTGELMEEVRNKVAQYGLERNVYFLGVKPNVNAYLSAADCYVMPSLYEGLPVAAVEAECSGLPCVLSENITDEVALTDKVRFLSLKDDAKKWAESIIEMCHEKRIDQSRIIQEKGYDVRSVANRMENFYLEESEKN